MGLRKNVRCDRMQEYLENARSKRERKSSESPLAVGIKQTLGVVSPVHFKQ